MKNPNSSLNSTEASFLKQSPQVNPNRELIFNCAKINKKQETKDDKIFNIIKVNKELTLECNTQLDLTLRRNLNPNKESNIKFKTNTELIDRIFHLKNSQNISMKLSCII